MRPKATGSGGRFRPPLSERAEGKLPPTRLWTPTADLGGRWWETVGGSAWPSALPKRTPPHPGLVESQNEAGFVIFTKGRQPGRHPASSVPSQN